MPTPWPKPRPRTMRSLASATTAVAENAATAQASARMLEVMSSTLAAAEAEVVAAVPHDLYVGGEWRPSSSGDTLPVEDPATEEVLCDVADATVDDAKAALDAAVAAAADWRATAPR